MTMSPRRWKYTRKPRPQGMRSSLTPLPHRLGVAGVAVGRPRQPQRNRGASARVLELHPPLAKRFGLLQLDHTQVCLMDDTMTRERTAGAALRGPSMLKPVVQVRQRPGMLAALKPRQRLLRRMPRRHQE
jgi:hypothetical protein